MAAASRGGRSRPTPSAQVLIRFRAAFACAGIWLGGLPAFGQPAASAAPTEPDWKGSVGAGLALTGGNSATSSFNVSFAASYEPKRKNSLKADGLYLRTEQDGAVSVDKTALSLRDEYRLDGRAFAFGELRYLRDVFKDIRYLVSPLAGIGYHVARGGRVELSLDAAIGGQFERDADESQTIDTALQAGQRLSARLSEHARFTARSSALWKTSQFGDAFYHFEAGIEASVSRRFELKLAFADDYKTRPGSGRRRKNDTSLLVALVFKIG